MRVLYGSEDIADRLWGKRPEWLRPAVGGLLLGLLLLAVPEMYGVGYPVLERAVAGHYVILALLGLMTAKIIATSLTMSIGGSGGVFAPSLFIGATLGSAYGAGAHALLPGLAAAAGAYGLVGMGAVFAASARAPITAVLVIFELTGDYRVILPLMIAVVVATTLSNAITHETIYTLKLRRRGIDIEAPIPSGMAAISVGEAMGTAPRALAPQSSLDSMIARFATEGAGSLPVLNTHGSLLGVVAASDVEAALGEKHARLTAALLAHGTPELYVDQSLEEAIAVLAASAEDGLPVLATGGTRLVGWIDHRGLLRAYQSRLQQSREQR